MIRSINSSIKSNEKTATKLTWNIIASFKSNLLPLDFLEIVFCFQCLLSHLQKWTTIDQRLLRTIARSSIQRWAACDIHILSNYDWSKNIVGLFFYLKAQLVEYEYIMKTTQSSITTINRFLKSKLLKLLCVIRNEIFHFQPIHELQRIVDVLEAKNQPGEPYHKSIVRSSGQTGIGNIRPTLRSATNLYKKLITYDEELTKISDEFVLFLSSNLLWTIGFLGYDEQHFQFIANDRAYSTTQTASRRVWSIDSVD